MDYILIKGIPAFEDGHLHNFLDGIVLGCMEFFGAGQITQFYFLDRLRSSRTGYLVYLFQKTGRELPYQKNIIMCLVSGEQSTGTVRALFELFFGNG